ISLLNGEAPDDMFTRELDRAIIDRRADIAVHSAKDLPQNLNPQIRVVALYEAFECASCHDCRVDFAAANLLHAVFDAATDANYFEVGTQGEKFLFPERRTRADFAAGGKVGEFDVVAAHERIRLVKRLIQSHNADLWIEILRQILG
ncbi:MAG: hypothetical protein IIT37_06390, partial [Bacteroidales bacterium]|nr:hypothetical protein [Bacteroidales bacterium]